MRVVVWSRRFATAGARAADGTTVMGSPEEVAAVSDVLSLHLALTPETRGLVDRRVLGRLRPGAYLVNTARAEVVDASALEDAIRNRGLRVATDVFAVEPADGEAPFHDPLLELPGVIGTHHIGGSTDQAQEAIAQEVVRIIRDWSEADDHRNPHS
jgi:D-3-phosphoglycerate dehydrogenase